MSKIKKFIFGSIEEIRHKVVWPTYSELQSSAGLVLIASFAFSLLIGVVDLVFKNAASWFYSTF